MILCKQNIWLFLDFNLGGLKLNFELRNVLLVISETLVNCSTRYIGASACMPYTTCLRIPV